MIHVAIAEDNYFLLQAIREKLALCKEFRVCFSAENGAIFLQKLEAGDKPHLVLMDIDMPVLNGIETTEILKKNHPQIKVLMLTVLDNDTHIFNAIKAGADGYLLKEVSPEELQKGILETLEGGAAMSPSIAFKTLKLLRSPIPENDTPAADSEGALSKRETEVLEQLSKGLSYNSIAENLCLSPFTIRKHIENIYRKLQVHSKIEALEKARKERFI